MLQQSGEFNLRQSRALKNTISSDELAQYIAQQIRGVAVREDMPSGKRGKYNVKELHRYVDRQLG